MSWQDDSILLQMVRETDMVAYLAMLGMQPSAIKNSETDFWYLSPFRNERTASFHVNRAVNQWYDFGLAAGGNMVDFCLRYYGGSVSDLLLKYNTDLPFRHLPGH